MDSRSRIEKGLLGFFGMFLIFFFVAVFGGCLSSCKGSFLAELAMIGTTGCMTAWSLWIKDSVGSSPTRLVERQDLPPLGLSSAAFKLNPRVSSHLAVPQNNRKHLHPPQNSTPASFSRNTF